MSEKHFGVDVSTWQTGCDYQKAVEEGGVEFAVLRAGFGKNAETQKDNMFEEHYAGFRKTGIPLGAFHYSYALSSADAVKEADAMLEWIKGKEFELPLFFDMEESKTAALGKETCTMIALAWCDRIAAAGYKCGVYANPNWFTNYLDADKIAEKYLIWCASWGTEKPNYKNLVMWQYGGETNKIRSKSVPGIGNVVDQNYYYGAIDTGEEKKEDDVMLTVRCTKKTTTLDAKGIEEVRRWIDVGDVCTIRLVEGPLIEITYPTSSGKRIAYIKSLDNFKTA